MEIPLTASAKLAIPNVAHARMELLPPFAQVAMTTDILTAPSALRTALRSTWLKSGAYVWREKGQPTWKAALKYIAPEPG